MEEDEKKKKYINLISSVDILHYSSFINIILKKEKNSFFIF